MNFKVWRTEFIEFSHFQTEIAGLTKIPIQMMNKPFTVRFSNIFDFKMKFLVSAINVCTVQRTWTNTYEMNFVKWAKVQHSINAVIFFVCFIRGWERSILSPLIVHCLANWYELLPFLWNNIDIPRDCLHFYIILFMFGFFVAFFSFNEKHGENYGYGLHIIIIAIFCVNRK